VDLTHKENAHNITDNYWAFGLGLDRFVMLFFDIPDIRYLWSTDDKFLNQFHQGSITKFKPFSNLKPINKDISFWLSKDDIANTNDAFTWLNEFYELIRDTSKDTVEEVNLLDKFYHNKKQKYSYTFRIKYTPAYYIKNPSDLTQIANSHIDYLRRIINKTLNVELR